MRQPTSPEERWRWYDLAMAGDNPPVFEMEPQCGFYAVRKFRYADWPRGPWLPARVWWIDGEIDQETGELLSDEILRAEIDGKDVNPWTNWTYLSRRHISESQWDWLRAMSPLLPSKPPSRG